jgi:hypothetical protein
MKTPILDDLDVIPTPKRSTTVRVLDDAALAETSQTMNARPVGAKTSKGGRSFSPVEPRRPGERGAFRGSVKPSAGDIRILMTHGVRNGKKLKVNVPLPTQLARRLDVAAPMNKASAIAALADYALTQLEAQDQLLFVETEIADATALPAKPTRTAAPAQFAKALGTATKDKTASLIRLADAVDDARHDINAKNHQIAALAALVATLDERLTQAIELLGPAGADKARRLGWIEDQSLAVRLADIERDAIKAADRDQPERSRRVLGVLAGTE